jgi:hypothetical protein
MRAVRRPWVAVVLLGIAVAGCDLVTGAFSSQASDEWRRSYPLEAGDVDILNVNGPITLEAVAGSTVEVVARRQARGRSEEAAHELLRRLVIQDQVDANRVRIETRPPSGSFLSGSTQVAYHVRVPAATNVVLRTTNGSLTIRRLEGRLKADIVNGAIEATDLAGAVEGSTVNGGIDVQVVKIAAGGIRLETTNGGITVGLPRNASADVHARVANGGISFTGLSVQQTGEVGRRRVDGRLGSGGPPLSLETVNGGIDVTGR